ncbi:transporter [Flavobacterium silvisoli]|uniref:Transporter n=1 Tax=Flavobacterium silvisoli TaxID=2529433 RepID=A0A4Q9YQK2_9FLAO|nr:transporter [Flavobacterium silvisoli]TBX65754.1 transporter [Flavobacterium silvisoli]
MTKLKRFFIAGFLLISASQYAQYTDIINSNRPGKSMSAFSVGKTVIQAEGGVYGIREKHDLMRYQANGFGTELDVRYGAFFDQFEFDLNTQYQYDWYQAPLVDDTRGGLKQFTIGAKYLVYDPFIKQDKPNLYSWKANHKFSWKQFIPAVAVYGGLNLKIGPNPFTFEEDKAISPKVMVITQHHFGSKWVWVNNIIADKYFTKYPTLGWITTMTRGFNMRWSAFLEMQAYKSDYYADNVFRLGAAYLVRENIQLDASLSKNVKDTPSLLSGNVGLSWRFDSNYETNYKRIKQEKDPKDKKDKKSKKDKGKKRKDEVELENTKP